VYTAAHLLSESRVDDLTQGNIDILVLSPKVFISRILLKNQVPSLLMASSKWHPYQIHSFTCAPMQLLLLMATQLTL
jgi:hypothetical protein